MENNQFQHLDQSELQLPQTAYIHDIDSRVFQAIALQCIVKTEGLSPIEGNLLDSFLGRDGADRLKGIYVEQNQKEHSVNFRIEINISYGLSIPEKSKEIQELIAQEVVKLTGLHVGAIHVIFKNIYQPKMQGKEKNEIEGEAELSYAEEI